MGNEKAPVGKSRENTKILCKYINVKRITRGRLVPIIEHSGNLWADPEDIACVLHEYFTSVITQVNEDECIDLGESVCEVLEQIDRGSDKLLEVLAGLKVEKSLVLSDLCPRLKRAARQGTAGALTQFFTSSLATEEVPEDWRTAILIPIFKRDGSDKLGDSRPAIVTLVVGKQLEKILKDRIYLKLDKFDGTF